jgi:hypothetical protein
LLLRIDAYLRPTIGIYFLSQGPFALSPFLAPHRRTSKYEGAIPMKRIFVSPFAVAVLWGVSLAQQPTSPPGNDSTPQEQQAPATTTPQPQTAQEPSTSPTPNSPSAQQNGQPVEQTPQTPQQAPQQAPQPVPPAAQQNPKSPSGNSPQSASASRIAPGSVIPVELTKSIDAKKVKTGDEVVAKVTMDLKTNSGEIVVPKDTKVVGHVTGAQTRSKEQKDSEVGIIFDRAVMKNGGEMEIPMSIQAIIAPQGSNSSTANKGNDQPTAAPSANASGASSNGGRAPGMGGTPPPAPNASTGGNAPTDASTAANVREPISGKTEGVVGLPDLKLATTAAAASQGSVVSSEKNNVKLESGTFMLLRVNQ